MSKTLRQTSMIAALVIAVAYLVYRALFTLNLDSWYSTTVSIALISAEIYGVFLMSLFFHQIWDTSEPEERPPLEGRTVDVLVPTYNEDIDLLRATLLAARDIEYPHKTYVLDDGRRPEVEALAAELGIGYFSRDNNLHAKAGNLNHALEKTDGEFVVIFDADHISKPHFISRTLGYFEEEDLGFVQTPHAFYNFDSFPARVNFKKRKYWEEGQLFYNVIQAGKNHWNAVVFCGSAAIFRRKALESVGLIATETITEDMHTGLRMHARGWKSYFVNERLIAGQAAPDSTTSQSQRLRWGEGNLSIIAHDNPLTAEGLTWPQRLNYFGSMISWTAGCARAVIYATPILMLLTGVAPVTNFSWLLGGLTLLYMFASWGALKVAGNGYGNIWRTEVASMADFWTQCRCTFRALLRRKRQRFVVTSKRGRQSKRWWTSIAPQVLVISLGLVAIGWATFRILTGVSDDWLGLSIGSVLIVLQAALAFAVLRHAMRPTAGVVTEHPTSGVHVRYSYESPETTLSGQAITTYVSEHGIGMIAYQELPTQQPLELQIDAAGRRIRFRGRARACEKLIDSHSNRTGDLVAYRYPIDLLTQGMTDRQRGELENSLLELGMNYSVQRWYQRFGLERVPPILEQSILEDTLSRSAARIRLPLEISDPKSKQQKWQGAVTEQLSDMEFKFLLDSPLAIGAEIEFRMDSPTGLIVGAGRVISVTERMLGREPLQLHHIELTRFSGQGRGRLQSLLALRSADRVKAAVNPTPKAIPQPMLRPLATISTPAIAAGLLLSLCFGVIYQDDLLINRVARTGLATPAEAVALRESYDRIVESGENNPGRLERLQEAMAVINEDNQEVSDVVDQLLARAPESRELRFAHAAQLEQAGELEAAFTELAALVDEMPIGKPVDSAEREFRERLYLQAARNAANREDRRTAVELFEMVDPISSDDADLRIEYAGLLVSVGRDEEAERLLEVTELTTDGYKLLASIYTSRDELARAERILGDMMRENPHERAIVEQFADVVSWQGRGAEAAGYYEHLLAQNPADSSLRVKAARAYLWSQLSEQSLMHFEMLWPQLTEDWKLRVDFLDAVAGAEVISPTTQTQLNTMFRDHRRLPASQRQVDLDAAYIRAFAVHNRSLELAGLLEERIAADKTNRQLREDLADLLHELEEFERADYHYDILLQQPETIGADSSETVFPPTASRARVGITVASR